MSNPTAPSHTSTLDVAATLGHSCPLSSCIYELMDFGGEHNPCGYAPTVAITVSADNSGFSFPGWFSGPTYNQTTHPRADVIGYTLDSASACQTLCQYTEGCQFFSYELEYNAAAGTQIHECYLKGHYTSPSNGYAAFDPACIHYTIWEPGPAWDQHSYDPDWYGASGPSFCGNFVLDSVQSVAVTTVPGYANAVVVAAAPSVYDFANGYLGFYDASTLAYLGCAEAGMKPEGIASNGIGQIACINEGSTYVNEHSSGDTYALDRHGSMTMCDVSGAAPSISCTTYIPNSTTFDTGAFLTAQQCALTPAALALTGCESTMACPCMRVCVRASRRMLVLL